MMTNLPGYHLSDTLYEGTRTLVYRGTRTNDSQAVIIKFLRSEYPTFNELVQFRNQYTITKNLDLPGIVKPLSLDTHGNGYALVMPSDGYISLGEWRKEQFSIVDFLTIAIQLVDILHGLYQNRVIHKDIKPANILIHPETKQVKLIDFSISSLLPKETLQISNPNVLEGTLAYISPEQTGRMNRGIDYRTDFYSLGVTFYELLAGKLPFQSDDPMELVHCHIAKLPTFPHTSHLTPRPLEDIVLKLMAKNAEDRYQSALGLKYDLEKCLYQWKETGNIEPFELGERDICDRFTIPEKLYGREGEVQTLLDAFERVAQGGSEMMLVAGFSGIGKTAVVNEVHKPIVRQRGYFIKGKYDQFNRNIPFSAFVSAFRDLMGQLLSESDEELTNWKAKILEAVGLNGQVLIDVIPELERVIGSQPPATELSGTAAQNRFNLLFQKFIAIFTTPEHPLVMFLDDLQWADSASLNLMKVLMGDSDRDYLLLLGAYRDNEVFPAHPLMLSLDEMQKRCDPGEETSPRERAPREQGANLNTLTLQPLSASDINHLVADTLLCEPEVARPISQLVDRKTQGNPFFTTQFLRGLHEEGYITFDLDGGYWQCNLTQVRQLALADDVVEFMVGRLRKLPQGTQKALKLAACIGNQFDLAMLAIVCEQHQEDVATDLWRALQEGLVIPENETYKFFQGDAVEVTDVENIKIGYRFLHDRVQQAAYALIPEEQKPLTHYRVGRLLLEDFSQEEQEQYIFDIVSHLNVARKLINQPAELEQLANLDLTAGQKALASTAYEAAIEYVEIGIELLGAQAWCDRYDLMLELYKALGSAQLSSVKHDQLKSTIQGILPHLTSPVDRAEFYVLQISSYSIQGLYAEAIKIGLIGLKELGNKIDRDNLERLIQSENAAIKRLLGERNIYELLDLDTTVPPEVKAEIKLAISLDPPTYIIGDINLYSVVSLRAVYLSIEHGNIPESVKSYANYGVLLGLMEQRYDRGYEFADMALQLAQKLNSKSQECQAGLLLGYWIHIWGRHINGAANVNYRSFIAGMDSGEIQFAAYNLLASILNRLFQGEHLLDIGEDINKYWLISEKIKHDSLRISLAASHIFISQLSLSQQAENQNNSILNPEEIIHHGEVANSLLTVSAYYILRMHLACLMGRFNEGLDYTQKAQAVLNGTIGSTTYSSYFYYMSLILLNIQSDLSSEEQSEAWEQIHTNQEQLKAWTESCPENFLHKYLLVEAEKSRILDQKLEAIELYDRAIAEAKANEYLQEEALANELAAKLYLDWGKENIAATYMVEAYYCYARWGAKAKTDQLEQTYPQLLTPILQQPHSSLTLDATTTLSSHQTLRTSTSSKTATSILDISAAIKASQALSGEIELEALLSQLMHIVIENAGADKGAFVLNNTETWEVVAQCIEETCELCATPLDNAQTLPASIVRAVGRTQQTILLNQVEKDTRFASDTYLIQQQPKSLFCTPILNQSRLIGILYLENNLSTKAFTPERVEVLNLLCSQAAISIENARLYENTQAANKMLHKSFEDLKQAQLQMVQSEKMSALGNLVAGVAHEINNPVGFIGGNLQPARDYVQDLLRLIDLYQEENPHPSEAIEDEIEAIDLDFLRSDLPKLIDSMKLGVDRIAHISTSLRTFSRTDKEHKVPFNLHDGLDSTILILKHRLKANEQRPAIEIVKEYGNIPEVRCFPGQLNQVFMNLIANAIDALDEGNAGRRFEEIAANPNRITIQTHIQDEGVTIRISDNGVGIPSEIKPRIFEQGFTTKGVGKGTGLGMAIARQIVEEKHGGTISCSSQPGRGTEFAIDLP